MPANISGLGGLPVGVMLVLLFAVFSSQPASPAQAQAKKAPLAAKPAASPAVKAAAQAKRGLSEGFARLKRGQSKQAVAVFSKLLANGGMTPADTSRALLGRAQAYLKLKKSAQAIADYSNALWIRKGLSAADRAAALRGRAKAYQTVGLNAQAQADLTAAAKPAPKRDAPVQAKGWVPATQAKAPAATKPAPRRTVVAKAPAHRVPPPKLRIAPRSSPAAPATPAPASSGWQTKTAPPVSAGWAAAPAAPPTAGSTPTAAIDGSAITGFFGNLFKGLGLNASPSAPETSQIATGSTPPAKRPAARSSQRPPAANPRVATAWSRATAVKPTQRPAVRAAAPRGTRYVQLDNLRSRTDAEAMAKRVQVRHAALLASRVPTVEANVLSSYGTYYRVRIGPFRTAKAGAAFCNQLRARDSTVDCFGIRP